MSPAVTRILASAVAVAAIGLAFLVELTPTVRDAVLGFALATLTGVNARRPGDEPPRKPTVGERPRYERHDL